MEFTGSQLFTIIGELYADLYVMKQQLIQANAKLKQLEAKDAAIQNPADRPVQHQN